MEKPIFAAMLSIAGTSLSDNEKMWMEKSNPLGISLFGRNIQNKTQLQKLCREIKETIGRDDVLIAVDQEGGRVRRLREPEFFPCAAQIDLGKIDDTYGADTALKTAKNHALLIAHDLKACGINWNYAPCLDICYPETTDALKSRCFSSDEKKAARLGKAMVDTYIQNGICPCIKHLPGHGHAACDPHLGLPIIKQSLKELEKDFYPFQVNNHSPAGMTAHIVLEAVDAKTPATQSKKVIDNVIRGIIGFDGFLISDAIDMHALKGRVEDKAAKALQAGCDAFCYCSANEDKLSVLTKQKYFLSDNSLIRLAKIRDILHHKSKVDIKTAQSEYFDVYKQIEAYDDKYDATEILHLMQKHKQESE